MYPIFLKYLVHQLTLRSEDGGASNLVFSLNLGSDLKIYSAAGIESSPGSNISDTLSASGLSPSSSKFIFGTI